MPLLKSSHLDLHFDVMGSGEPMLFIQGVGVIGNGWLPQAEELSKNFQTIVFDNRGIGQSTLRQGEITIEDMVNDTISLLDHLQIPSAHVVGHSMGGVIAHKMAIEHPRRVKSLSLLCSFSKGSQATQLNPRILWLGMRSQLGTKRMRRNAFLEILYSRRYLSGIPSTAELAAATEKLVGRDLAVSPPIVMKQLRALGRHDSSSDLGKLSGTPTLVIQGKEDPIALPMFGEDLALRIPGAKCQILDHAAHGIVLERPGEINRMILDFIASESPPV